MKTIKLCTLLTLICFGLTAIAQEKESAKTETTPVVKKEKDKRLARNPWGSDLLMNNLTTDNLKKQTLGMTMQHRFGTFDKGIQDLFGLYGASTNIRIGFDYGIIDRVQVGFGFTKGSSNGLLFDFRGKGALLQQTRTNRIPISITMFNEMSVSVKKDPARFAKGTNRLSYFHQLIISRKFTDWCSIQVQGSYMHYNIVDSGTINHDNFAVGISGRFKVSPQSSIMFEFDYPLLFKPASGIKTYPNIGLGWEISTGSHAFQIFLASCNGIIPQENMVYNKLDFKKPKTGWVLGFNITRRWGFTGEKKKSKGE